VRDGVLNRIREDGESVVFFWKTLTYRTPNALRTDRIFSFTISEGEVLQAASLLTRVTGFGSS